MCITTTGGGWRTSITVRIRFAHGERPVLTAKLPESWEGLRRTMQEIEVPVAGLRGGSAHVAPRSIDVAALPLDIGRALHAAGCERLRRAGWVRNERTVIALPGAGHAELDRLRLPDGMVVYEVEIETSDRSASDRATTMIRRAAPTARPSRLSKYERFRRAIEAGRNTNRDE
jgi:hypothetical protein